MNINIPRRIYMLTSSVNGKLSNRTLSLLNKIRRFAWLSFLAIMTCTALILISENRPAVAQTLSEAYNAQLARDPATNLGCARLVGGSTRDTSGEPDEPDEFGPELADICGDVPGGGTGPSGGTTIGAASPVTGDVGKHLRKTREGEDGEEADVDLGSGISLWINGNYQELDRDTTRFEDGYDSDIWGVTIGVDFQVNESMLAGLAFNFNRSDGDYESAGNFDTDSYGPIVYASFFPSENFFTEVILSYLWSDVSSDRSRTYINEVGEEFGGKVSADPDENHFNIGLQLGYDYHIRAFTVSPRLTFDYDYANLDSYAERGNTGLELKYDEDSRVSFQSKLGVEASMVLRTAFGEVVPQVSADWVHEYADNQRSISVQYVQDLRDNPTKFAFQTDKPDRDSFELSAGVSVELPNDNLAFATYSTLVSHNFYDRQTVTIGLRVTF